MLGFRAKLNKDPELVNLICTRFVPVAVDHEVERRKDAEGELYRKVAGKAVSNSVFAFDPSGKLLFQRLGGQIYEKYVPALEAAIKDYQPAKADCEESAYRRRSGRTLLSRSRRRGGRSRDLAYGQRRKGWPGPERWGRDNLWIRKDEVAALAKGQLPDSLKKRIARCHLINTTGGHLTAGAMWKPEHVKRLDMTPCRRTADRRGGPGRAGEGAGAERSQPLQRPLVGVRRGQRRQVDAVRRCGGGSGLPGGGFGAGH